MSNKTVKMPIGMRKSYFGQIVSEPDNAHPVYGTLMDMGAARKGYLTVTTAAVEIPGDDIVQVYDEKFVSAQADVETDCSDLELNAAVYGHAYATGVESSGANDTAPYGFYAFIEPILLKNKTIIYRATYLYKVCAMQASEKVEADTKQPGSLDPKVNAVSFKVMCDNTGVWRDREEFDSEAAADAWIRGLAGATAVWPVRITNIGNGTSTPGTGVIYVAAGQNQVIDFGSSDPTALYDNGTTKTPSSHKYTISSIAGAHDIVAIWPST